LGKLIAGELPLADWMAVVRTTVPPPARWRPAVRLGFWTRLRERIQAWFRREKSDRYETFTPAEAGSVSLRGEPMSKEGTYATDHRDS
jgi:hypothetical protein